jgi:hypothetical protein
MELETALECILESGAEISPDAKIDAIIDLLKDTKPDEFTKPILTFLKMANLSSQRRINQIAQFIDARKEKNANQQQYEITKRKLNNEMSRPWGEKRANVDVPWNNDPRRSREAADDECQCDACCVRLNWCSLFPRVVRPTLLNGLRWLFFGAAVVLVVRYLWFSAGRAF